MGVEYIYQNDFNRNINNLKDVSSFQLTSKSLLVMPNSWLQELKQAAGELDESSLEELIMQIPDEYSHIANSLTNLADNFEFKQIFELITI